MKKPEDMMMMKCGTTPAPGVGDPVSQDDNTTLTDAKASITIVSGPNSNQGGK